MTSLKSNLNKCLKPYAKYIPDINKATMRSMLKQNQRYSKEAYDKEVAKLLALNQDEPRDYEIYCTIVMILLETFLKSKRSGDDLSEALRELKFRDECVEDLTKALTANRESLHEHFKEMKLAKPLKNFEHKINISLMESGQQPTVILHLENNGEMKTINLSLKQFHSLRLATASALAEMHALEGKRT